MQPIEFFTIVGSAAAVLGILITWMTRRFDKLDADIKALTSDSHAKWTAATSRTDTLFIAMNQRTDELIKSGNARFDASMARIDKMLEKQGK